MISRRRIVIALGAGALAVPFASFPQQLHKVWRIGVLWEQEQSDYIRRLEAFRGGMLQHIEARQSASIGGQQLYRPAGNHY
jgi:hypothetical protein